MGLHRGGPDEGELPRGAFSLYVPERCDGKTPLPLVVALHGGFGHGHDFVWTWLREARSRQFLLLAPSSRGATWSLDAPPIDQRELHALVESVCASWPVDRQRLLLTGLSDGATFTLLAGLAEDSPFSHLAPVSGVLHPANFGLGNLARARGRRVRLCHGALDWLFPGDARAGRARRAGARRSGDRVPRDRGPLARLSAGGERRDPALARGGLSNRRTDAKSPPVSRLRDRRAFSLDGCCDPSHIAEMSNPSTHPMRSLRPE